MEKIALIILALTIGILIGWTIKKSIYIPFQSNGKIILSKNEEGIDRIFFNLDLEYEDFKKYSQIVFDVINEDDA